MAVRMQDFDAGFAKMLQWEKNHQEAGLTPSERQALYNLESSESLRSAIEKLLRVNGADRFFSPEEIGALQQRAPVFRTGALWRNDVQKAVAQPSEGSGSTKIFSSDFLNGISTPDIFRAEDKSIPEKEASLKSAIQSLSNKVETEPNRSKIAALLHDLQLLNSVANSLSLLDKIEIEGWDKREFVGEAKSKIFSGLAQNDHATLDEGLEIFSSLKQYEFFEKREIALLDAISAEYPPNSSLAFVTDFSKVDEHKLADDEPSIATLKELPIVQAYNDLRVKAASQHDSDLDETLERLDAMFAGLRSVWLEGRRLKQKIPQDWPPRNVAELQRKTLELQKLCDGEDAALLLSMAKQKRAEVAQKNEGFETRLALQAALDAYRTSPSLMEEDHVVLLLRSEMEKVSKMPSGNSPLTSLAPVEELWAGLDPVVTKNPVQRAQAYEEIVLKLDQIALARTIEMRMAMYAEIGKTMSPLDKFLNNFVYRPLEISTNIFAHIVALEDAANGFPGSELSRMLGKVHEAPRNVLRIEFNNAKMKYAEVRRLLESGDFESARREFAAIEGSQLIPRLEATAGAAQDFNTYAVGVGIVMASAFTGSVAADVLGPYAVEVMGATWGARVMLAANATTFTVTHRALQAYAMDDANLFYDGSKSKLENTLSFGEEVAGNFLMFGYLGKVGKGFEKIAQTRLLKFAEKQLVAEGAIKEGSQILPGTKAAEKLADRMADLRRTIHVQALLKGGSFVAENAGFGAWGTAGYLWHDAKNLELHPVDAVKNTILSPRAWRDSALFLFALKAGGTLASPLTKSLQNMSKQMVAGRYGQMLKDADAKLKAAALKLDDEKFSPKDFFKECRSALENKKFAMEQMAKWRDTEEYAVNEMQLAKLERYEKAYDAANRLFGEESGLGLKQIKTPGEFSDGITLTYSPEKLPLIKQALKKSASVYKIKGSFKNGVIKLEGPDPKDPNKTATIYLIEAERGPAIEVEPVRKKVGKADVIPDKSGFVSLPAFLGLLTSGARADSTDDAGVGMSSRYQNLLGASGEKKRQDAATSLLKKLKSNQVPVFSENIHNDMHQTDDPNRSAVELGLNGLDAGSKDLNVTVKDGSLVVVDRGTGLNGKRIATKLLPPKLSDKPDAIAARMKAAGGALPVEGEEEIVGRFGIGFYTALAHLKGPGDRVVLETRTEEGESWRLTFANRGGEIFIKPEKLSSSADMARLDEYFGAEGTGTRIEIKGDDIKQDAMESELKRYMRFVEKDKPVVVNGRAINDHNLTETMRVPFGKKTASVQVQKSDHGKIVVMAGNAVIEEYDVSGNVPNIEFVIKLPASAGLSITRDKIAADAHVESAIKAMVDKTDDVAMLNLMTPMLRELDSRNSSNALMQHARGHADFIVHKILEREPSARFLPDEPALRSRMSSSPNVAWLAPELYSPAYLDNFATPSEFKSGEVKRSDGSVQPMKFVLVPELESGWFVDYENGIFLLDEELYRTSPGFVLSTVAVITHPGFRIHWASAEDVVAPAMHVFETKVLKEAKAGALPEEVLGKPAEIEKVATSSEKVDRTGIVTGVQSVAVAAEPVEVLKPADRSPLAGAIDAARVFAGELAKEIWVPLRSGCVVVGDALKVEKIDSNHRGAVLSDGRIVETSEGASSTVAEYNGGKVVIRSSSDEHTDIFNLHGVLLKSLAGQIIDTHEANSRRLFVVLERASDRHTVIDLDLFLEGKPYEVFSAKGGIHISSVGDFIYASAHIMGGGDVYAKIKFNGASYEIVSEKKDYIFSSTDEWLLITRKKGADIQYFAVDPDGREYHMYNESVSDINARQLGNWLMAENTTASGGKEVLLIRRGSDVKVIARRVRNDDFFQVGESVFYQDSNDRLMRIAPNGEQREVMSLFGQFKPLDITLESGEVVVCTNEGLMAIDSNGNTRIIAGIKFAYDVSFLKVRKVEDGYIVNGGLGNLGFIKPDGSFRFLLPGHHTGSFLTTKNGRIFAATADDDKSSIYEVFTDGRPVQKIHTLPGSIFGTDVLTESDDFGIIRLYENNTSKSLVKITADGEVYELIPPTFQIEGKDIGRFPSGATAISITTKVESQTVSIFGKDGNVLLQLEVGRNDEVEIFGDNLVVKYKDQGQDNSKRILFLPVAELEKISNDPPLLARLESARKLQLPLASHIRAIANASDIAWSALEADPRRREFLSELSDPKKDVYVTAHADASKDRLRLAFRLIDTLEGLLPADPKKTLAKLDALVSSDIDLEKVMADMRAGRESDVVESVKIFASTDETILLRAGKVNIAAPRSAPNRLADVVAHLNLGRNDILRGKETLPGYSHEKDEREVLHAVHHLHATDQYAYLREFLQNSLDVQKLGRIPNPADRKVEITTKSVDGKLVVGFRDHGGMTENEFLGLINPGVSGKPKIKDLLGGLGMGFFSSLAGGNWVRLKTAVKGSDTVILASFDVERNADGKITDIKVRFEQVKNSDGFYGTEIESERAGKMPLIEAARLVARIKDLGRYVSEENARVELNGEVVNAGRANALIVSDDPQIGKIEIYDGLAPRLLLGGLPLSALPDSVTAKVPQGIMLFYKRLGFYVNLDHTRLQPTPTRDRLQNQGEVTARLGTVLPGMLVSAFLRRVADPRYRENIGTLPQEYFITAYDFAGRKLSDDIIQQGRLIAEGKWDQFDAERFTGPDAETDILQLLTVVPFVNVEMDGFSRTFSLREMNIVFQQALNGDVLAKEQLARIKKAVPPEIAGRLDIAERSASVAKINTDSVARAIEEKAEDRHNPLAAMVDDLRNEERYEMDSVRDPLVKLHLTMLQDLLTLHFRRYVPDGNVQVGLHTVSEWSDAFALHYRVGDTYHLYRCVSENTLADARELARILAEPDEATARRDFRHYLVKLNETASHELTHAIKEHPDQKDFTHSPEFYSRNIDLLFESNGDPHFEEELFKKLKAAK